MPSHINPAYKNEEEFSLGDKASSSDNFNSLTFKIENMSSRSPNETKSSYSRQRYVTVAVLCFINLINYVDRFTIAGILNTVQAYYSLDNTQSGLLQTSFVCSYMIMAPLFGYLGDRYSRKLIIAFGVTFWSLTTLLGSFIPSDLFGIFIFLRALVGTGEASYSTIAPTIIADLFSKDKRSKMLAIFYFAIPVGSGLGYIIGAQILQLTGEWQWALRITPIFGFASVILTLLYVKDPPRGEAEGGEIKLEKSTLSKDLLYLSKTKSFVYSTLGFTCVTFATGALGWFGPIYMELALAKQFLEPIQTNAALIFGVITCIAGVVGVIIGSFASTYLRRFNAKADPLICAYGVLISVPLIFCGVVVSEHSIITAWVLIFLGEVCLCVNWTIVADMLLYVIVPTRRSIAEAAQILVAHALGDACSPYIIGQVSDSINETGGSFHKYLSLQYALYIPTGVLVLGAFFFFLTALHIEKDKAKCNFATHGLYPPVHICTDDPIQIPADDISDSRHLL